MILEGAAPERSESPAKVPRACRLVGGGNIKPVWKSNSRVRTEGGKEGNIVGENETEADALCN